MYASGGFYPKTINGSLRFNDDDSALLSRTPSSAGNRRTFTISFWAKKGVGGFETIFRANLTTNNYEAIQFTSDDQLRLFGHPDNSNINCTTNAVLRDPSAWYHFVFEVDTTQATASNRVKIYINGSLQSLSTATYPSQNADLNINNTTVHHWSGEGSYDGYLAEVFLIDGTAHDVDAFGETKNGIWVPKNITSSNFTMGTNGFHLTFEDDTTVEAFNTVLYEGNGGTQSVTGTGFEPDFVWIKNRDNADDHYLYDSVRGPLIGLNSNQTIAEVNSSNDLSSFDSDGFTVGSDGGLNRDDQSIVAWCWDAGGTSQTATYVVKVVSDSGNKYRFDDFGTSAITLELSEGGTYRFDQSDSSNSGHPLRFSTTSDGTHGSGSEYTTGVTTNGTPGSSGAYTEITVASGAPTLYYYCTNHSGMGGQANTPSTKGYTNVKGTIQSKVVASDTTGFSIVSYTGNGSNNSTVGHGLSSTPSWVLTKSRTSGTDNWSVWHSGLTSIQYYLSLNTTDKETSGSDRFGTNDPTSSVMNLGYAGSTNSNGANYIMYCWTETTGVSKFGSYTGQPNITTGFKPAFILIKNITDNGTDWVLWDNTRNADNGNRISRPNLANTDASETIDISNTGFTAGTGSYVGASGKTYIYMAFADTRDAAFWLDSSSNDNDFQHVNVDHNDTVSDSPTDNHATLNPSSNPMGATLSDGNLKAVNVQNDKCYFSTIAMKDEKFYFEVTLTNQGNRNLIGIINSDVKPHTTDPTSDSISMYAQQGNDRDRDENGEGSSSSTGTWSTGNVITFAVDLTTGKIYVGKNAAPNTAGTPNKSDLNTSLSYLVFCQESGSSVSTNTFNFGQSSFAHTPPDGFVALSTANLPAPAIDPAQGENPTEYFNTLTETGNTATSRAFTGAGFQPDWLWSKSRSATRSHALFDSVRGVTKYLAANSTDAELSSPSSGFLSSFDADGFTATQGSSNFQNLNNNSETYVYWLWKAGTSFSNDASATGVGTIDSTGSVSTEAGFSIISYTGTGSNATVGHGLGAVPEWIIFRDRNNTNDWGVYHVGLGNTDFIKLNSNGANLDEATLFNDTTPTSSVFSLGSANIANNTGATIAYCFAPKEGYSKFGIYDDNVIGSDYENTSPFVYTGFRPAWLMIKGTSAGRDWVIYDNKRTPDDGVYLRANESAAEQTDATNHDVSFLSNGFKIRGGSGDINTTNESYIYMAFADQPLKFANGGTE
tara:strand:- start:457 stop:4119 length:3663 start_codon:yes stop_codon:yes gene_type:complete